MAIIIKEENKICKNGIVMGKWMTHEKRLAYHRDYNACYRKEHPEKISGYKQKGKEKRMKEKEKKEVDARECHRLTILVDEHDEGFLI